MHFQATIGIKFVGFDVVREQTDRQALTLEEILYGGGDFKREEEKNGEEERYGCQRQRLRHCNLFWNGMEDF